MALFGKKEKAAPTEDPVEAYQTLISQIAQIARAKIYDDPDCPRSIDRVVRAEEAVEARHQELADIEAQMDELDAATQDLKAQIEEERERSSRLVERWKKPVEAQLKRVKDAQSKLKTKEGNLRYAQKALEKEELKLQDAIDSNDAGRIDILRQNNKKLRLEYMKQERELGELREEVERLKYPTGVQGEDAIHARMRLLELENQLEQQEEDVKAQLAELDQAAADKEQEIQGAEEFLAEAMYLFGEDVYASRTPDPQLDRLYADLDHVATQLPAE